jgi:hypothetical protein
MKTTLKPFPPAKSAEEEEAEVDRLLGDQLLFNVDDPQKRGGPSPQVIFRARRAGLIELVDMGGLTKLSRATMKLIMMKGLPRIPFLYGKQGTEQAAKELAARKLIGKGKRA